jgi:hypothetical protein
MAASSPVTRRLRAGLALLTLVLVSSASAPRAQSFWLGWNLPWYGYGHTFGANQWGHDGVSTDGWAVAMHPSSRGFLRARAVGDEACSGSGALRITADLDATRASGEVTLDLGSHLPTPHRLPASGALDLRGRTMTFAMRLPFGSAGSPSAPNGIQAVFKTRLSDELWPSVYTTWRNIDPSWEGRCMLFSVPVSLDGAGHVDPGADLSRVRLFGVKFGLNSAATSPVSGIVLLDDVLVDGQPALAWDFESLQIDREFRALREISGNAMTAVRVFVCADGRACPEFGADGRVVGYDEHFYDDVDALVAAASRNGGRVILVVLDYLAALQARTVSNVQLGGRAGVFRDPGIRQSFLDLALDPFVARYARHPAVMAIELVNEPEWVIEELPERIPSGVDYVPQAALNEFVRLAAERLHRHAPQQTATLGSARRDWTTRVAGLGLDLYGVHWYDHFEDVEPFPLRPCPQNLDGPCDIGEVPTASTAHSATEFVSAGQAAGYAGLAFWSSRAGDAFSDLPQALANLYLGDAPGLYPAVVTTSNVVTLSWTPSRSGPPPTGYLVQASLTPSGQPIATLPAAPTATSLTVTAPAGVYYVTIRKLVAAGPGPVSNESAVVVGAPPAASNPRQLAATVAGSTVTLTWLPPANVAVSRPTYLVEAGRAPSLSDLGVFPTGSEASFFAATGVPAGRYYVRVRARNQSGTSPPSNDASVSVGIPAAGPPTGLVGSAVGGVVTLSWNPPASGAALTGYELQAGDRPGSSNLARIDLTAATTTVQYTGVPAGTYYVRVVSVDAFGPSAASNEIVLVVP